MVERDFKVKAVITTDLKKELSKIGFDNSYLKHAENKYRYKNIKIYSLSSAQANIIKQTALSVGADCATHRDVITGKIEYSDVILGGSFSELNKIADKLGNQPFSLSNLSDKIRAELKEKQTNTKIVGILNITPNSFSDGGKYYDFKAACNHINELISDGADIIDIGAESTKPGASPVDSDEQIQRLAPVIEYINSANIAAPISIDTRSSTVAEYCLKRGASIINDVSGLKYDKNMAKVVSDYDATVVIQHSMGNQITKKEAKYKNLVDDIYLNLYNRLEYAKSFGINKIITDVGIGFDKTGENDFELIERIQEFYSLGYPVMLGLSRKSFLGLSSESNDEKDIYTLAFNMLAIKNNVDYIRVHNVKLHKKLLEILTKTANADS